MSGPRITEEQFWVKANRSGPNECWEWTGYRDKDGYGNVMFGGKKTTPHRVALALTDGGWNSPLHVLHLCDNPPCCNPAHLRRGTPADNIADMFSKGRAASRAGERSHFVKLTDDIVAAIRNSNEPQWLLAKRYSVGRPLVSMIKRRKIWKHLP